MICIVVSVEWPIEMIHAGFRLGHNVYSFRTRRAKPSLKRLPESAFHELPAEVVDVVVVSSQPGPR